MEEEISKSIGIVVLLVWFILILGYVGGSLLFGSLAGDYFQKVTRTVVVATTTVSVVAEQEACDKVGGDFHLSGTEVGDRLIMVWPDAPQLPRLEVSCTKTNTQVISDKTFY